MKIHVLDSPRQLGSLAAQTGADAIRKAIRDQGFARIIVATGASQFETLAALVEQSDIDWSKVTGFHLDEYLGVSGDHPASFVRYLRERFVTKVPLLAFHYLDGLASNAEESCKELGEILNEAPIDAAFVGIGENGHLAFNDPPADFETDQAYLVVELDEACRRQQAGEGWFETIDDVPRRAISMSCRQILRSKTILCSVPDRRKAVAVRASIEGAISPDVPASILQSHGDTHLFLDQAAASLLTRAQSST